MKKQHLAAFCFLVLILVAFSAPALAAQPEPVTTDPVSAGRRSLFKDNEVVVHTLGCEDGQLDNQWVKVDDLKNTTDNLENWNLEDSGESPGAPRAGGDYRPIAGGSGRLESYKYDSSVRAFFRQSDNALTVEVQRQPLDQGVISWSGGTCSQGQGRRSIDMAVADLDGYTSTVQDDNGKDIVVYFDEILVAYPIDGAGSRTFRMDVLGMAADGTLGVLATDSYQLGYEPDYISVATGDFDDDGENEFAVCLSSGQDQTSRLLTYKMTVDKAGGRTLERIDGRDLDLLLESLDMAAGDFDGDGRDELCMVFQNTWIWVWIWQWEPASDDGKTSPAQWVQKYLDIPFLDVAGLKALSGDIRVTSGLFILDPENNYNFNKRQILVGLGCYIYPPNPDHYIKLTLFDASDLGSPTKLSTLDLKRYGSQQHLDLAAGNFVGHGVNGDQTSPTDQILLTYIPVIQDSKIACMASFLKADGNRQLAELGSIALNESAYHGDTSNPPWYAAATAPDLDGDTWLLGMPAHAVVSAYQSLDYYIQEPPKHVDYLPLDSTDWSPGPENWAMINVSDLQSFKSSLNFGTDDNLSSSTKQTSSWDIGQTKSFSFEEGFDIGAFSASKEDKTKMGRDYEEEESSYNKNYFSKSVEHNDDADQDDMLVYRSMRLDIWRYPVLGFDTGAAEKPLGCYELVFPSGVESNYTSGLYCTDWFQPPHSLHNILSYPDAENFGAGPPDGYPEAADISDYTLTPDPDKNQSVVIQGQCINDPTERTTVETNNGSWTIEWVDSTEQEAERSVKNTTTQSEEITYKASGHFEYLGGVSVEDSFSFDSKSSWGLNTNRTSEHSSSTGIKMEYDELPISKSGAYKIGAAAFFDTTGALRLVYGTSLLENVVSFYDNYYNMYPDPGLNLNNRFDYDPHSSNVDKWTLATEEERLKARGIFIRESTPNPVTGKYEFLGLALADGDQALVCARVTNFSLMNTGAFRVRFEFVPVDKSLHEMDDRTLIGYADVPVPGLGPRETREVRVNWDTTGLYHKYPDPTHPGEYATYRLYVVVDPDDDVSPEIHDWKDPANAGLAGWADDQGRLYHGNNEGYWPNGSGIDILMPPPPAGPRAPVEVSLHEKSLAIEVGGQLLDEDGVVLPMGRTYPLRVELNHSGPIRRLRHVIFREGDPVTTRKVIGDHLIFGASGSKAAVWGQWTPGAPGEYDLHVQVEEEGDDPIPGNVSDTLHVTVTGDAPNPEPGPSWSGSSGSDWCFIGSLLH